MTKLKVGQTAKVDIAGAGQRTGTVRLVSPEVDTATRLGHVRIFLGDDPDLRIGTFARAMISAGTRDSVGLPSTAVLYDEGRATVLVVNGDKVAEREVKTGLSSGDRVEITAGLKPGEIVVQRAGTLLRDGEKITPVFPDKTLSEAAQ
jgi:multidrug efflux pump subunit AcrA (membrane-fusion protein)